MMQVVDREHNNINGSYSGNSIDTQIDTVFSFRKFP